MTSKVVNEYHVLEQLIDLHPTLFMLNEIIKAEKNIQIPT